MVKYDAAVIGLGAAGSAALLHLARRGLRVIGIDRFSPGHEQGSSHGGTRIIRLGYFEHPSYVPLLRRAYEMWRELEARSGRALMRITGIAEIGQPDGTVVPGTLLASRTHALPHEILSAAEVMKRFPAFRLPGDFIGVVQPDGGHLAVESAIEAQIRLAQEAGAHTHFDEQVRTVTPRDEGVRIRTSEDTIEARTAIVAAGPWVNALVPGLPLRVTRQVMTWYRPRDPAPFADDRFPVFLLESAHGIHYGFPPHGAAGVKISKHHHRDETVDPDRVDRSVTAADEAMVRPVLADHIPAANGPRIAAKTCLYTMSPDGDFVIGRAPGLPRVIVGSACSGHGFKFAPVLGEILAELAMDGGTRHDISRFSPDRFA